MSTVNNLKRVLGGTDFIPNSINSDLDYSDVIISGLPHQSVKHVQEYIGASEVQMANFLAITPKTYRSRKDRYTLDESNHVFAIAKVVSQAETVLGSKEDALKWLNSMQMALGDRVPFEIIKTVAGQHAVEDLLGKIYYGVYV